MAAPRARLLAIGFMAGDVPGAVVILVGKKSQLVDALSQLRLDEENRERYLAAGTAIPEATVRQARRSVETDRIAIATAERTLRSWRLTEEEVDAVKAEAERIRQRG